MIKSILNLGSILNKSEQKNINGGLQYDCDPSKPEPCQLPTWGNFTVECINNRCVYTEITPF